MARTAPADRHRYMVEALKWLATGMSDLDVIAKLQEVFGPLHLFTARAALDDALDEVVAVSKREAEERLGRRLLHANNALRVLQEAIDDTVRLRQEAVADERRWRDGWTAGDGTVHPPDPRKAEAAARGARLASKSLSDLLKTARGWSTTLAQLEGLLHGRTNMLAERGAIMMVFEGLPVIAGHTVAGKLPAGAVIEAHATPTPE